MGNCLFRSTFASAANCSRHEKIAASDNLFAFASIDFGYLPLEEFLRHYHQVKLCMYWVSDSISSTLYGCFPGQLHMEELCTQGNCLLAHLWKFASHLLRLGALNWNKSFEHRAIDVGHVSEESEESIDIPHCAYPPEFSETVSADESHETITFQQK